MKWKHVLQSGVLEWLGQRMSPQYFWQRNTYIHSCDNTFGSSDSPWHCVKETTGFKESWSTEHGFNLEVTVGAQFEAGTLFAKATTTFELSLGYSFMSGYSKSQTYKRSETFHARWNKCSTWTHNKWDSTNLWFPFKSNGVQQYLWNLLCVNLESEI